MTQSVYTATEPQSIASLAVFIALNLRWVMLFLGVPKFDYLCVHWYDICVLWVHLKKNLFLPIFIA